MKKFRLISVHVMFLVAAFTSFSFAQNNESGNQNQVNDQIQTHGNNFVDVNGDGYNDNAPDIDGDGIPNGRDEDYSGSQFRRGNRSRGFVDLNCDGINDYAIDTDGDGIPNGQDPDYIRPKVGTGNQNGFGRNGYRGGYRWGPNDGTGNNGIGPKNGNGNGPCGNAGFCNGTGPKGNRGGRR